MSFLNFQNTKIHISIIDTYKNYDRLKKLYKLIF